MRAQITHLRTRRYFIRFQCLSIFYHHSLLKLNKQKGWWVAYTCSTTIIKLGAVLVGHWSVRLSGYLFPLGLKGFVLVVTHVTFVYGLTKHSTRVQIRYLTVSDLEFLSLNRRHRLKIKSASRCCPFKNWLWITDDRLRYQSCNRNRKWLFVRLCKDIVWKKVCVWLTYWSGRSFRVVKAL